MSTRTKAWTTWADGDEVNDVHDEDDLDGDLDGFVSAAQLVREYDAFMLTTDRPTC